MTQTTTISALLAHKCTTKQFVNNFDGADATPLTLGKFITAQSAEDFCQNAAIQLGQAETEFTLNN